MISDKEQANIRNNYPVPRTPLELIIAKEEPEKPIILDAEVAIFLGDFARRFPGKWPTVKERINNPDSSYNDLAARLNINRSTVIRHLKDLRAEARNYLKRGAV